MESIRINELARELEVKSKAVLDYLPEIGVTDKKSHSSALDEETTAKVRAHFREQSPIRLDVPWRRLRRKHVAPWPLLSRHGQRRLLKRPWSAVATCLPRFPS